MRRKKITALTLACIAAVGLVGIPSLSGTAAATEIAQADAITGDTRDKSDFEGTQIYDAPAISPAVESRIEAAGADPDQLAAIQVGENGNGMFFEMEDGSWVLDLADASTYEISVGSEAARGATSQAYVDIAQSEASALAFTYTFCTGHFFTPKKVSNYLQWGAQSDCRSASSSVYVHDLAVDLYNTCVGPLCAVLETLWAAPSPEGHYGKLQTASGTDRCESLTEDRTYEQRARVRVRSVDFGPFWERDVVVKDCDVHYNP